MPINKNQMMRMVKIVAELKINNYPNAAKMEKILEAHDRKIEFSDKGKLLSAARKTLQRDFGALKKEFDAPIEYDESRHGYFLTDPYWQFQCPILEDVDFIVSMLGSKIAENIFPAPLKDEARKVVDAQITTNSPDIQDNTFLNTIIIGAGSRVKIDPTVFRTVYDAWQANEVVAFTYVAGSGKTSSRRVEPHGLIYQDGVWYIKAFDQDKEESRTFAIHRISDIINTYISFTPNPGYVEGGLFSHADMVTDIEVKCNPKIAGYARDYDRGTSGRELIDHPDGSVTIKLASMAKIHLIKWILSDMGNSELIRPKSLRDELKEIAAEIAHTHS